MDKMATKNSRVVRLSNEVADRLKEFRRGRESYDHIIRVMLGLPTTKHNNIKIKEFWALRRPTMRLYKDKGEAKGAAITRAVKDGLKHPEPVKRVVEL